MFEKKYPIEMGAIINQGYEVFMASSSTNMIRAQISQWIKSNGVEDKALWQTNGNLLSLAKGKRNRVLEIYILKYHIIIEVSIHLKLWRISSLNGYVMSEWE